MYDKVLNTPLEGFAYDSSLAMAIALFNFNRLTKLSLLS